MSYRIFKFRALALGVWVALLPACAKDVLVGRYKEALCEAPNVPAGPCHDVLPTADVSVVTIKTPAPPATPTNGTNFTERALAEYIKALADPKLSATAKDLRQNLAASIKGEEESAAVEDRSVFHRTMIVTVAKDGRFNPADRLEATDILIQPTNANIESWDTATTLYTTINAGTLQVTQTRNAETTLTVGAPPGPVPISGSVGEKLSQGTTRAETFNATNQVDNLTVFSDGKNLRIHRQGGTGIDLTGNIIIKADLVLSSSLTQRKPVFSIVGDYLDKAGKWTLPQALTVKSKIVNVATQSSPIQASVTLTYTVRHVISGDDTLEERDDYVIERTVQNTPKQYDLVPGRQVGPPSLGLWSPTDLPVYIRRPQAARDVALCFDSFEAAEDLIAYIQNGNPTHPESLGNATLGFSNIGFVPLKPQDVGGLIVHSGCP